MRERTSFPTYFKAFGLLNKRWFVVSAPALVFGLFYWTTLALWPLSDNLLSAKVFTPSPWMMFSGFLVSISLAQYSVWKDEHQKQQNAATENETALTAITRDYELACAQRETATTALKDLKAELQSERDKNELKHPDVIIERNGNSATGTLVLYNRGSTDAFNVSINALSCDHGMVLWQTATRLPAGKTAAITFTVSGSNAISSIQHDSVNLLAQMLHFTYPEHMSEEQLAKAVEPVKRWVSVDYFDVLTKTNWQTPCQFIYDRKAGELTVTPGDAVPTVAYPPIPNY